MLQFSKDLPGPCGEASGFRIASRRFGAKGIRNVHEGWQRLVTPGVPCCEGPDRRRVQAERRDIGRQLFRFPGYVHDLSQVMFDIDGSGVGSA